MIITRGVRGGIIGLSFLLFALSLFKLGQSFSNICVQKFGVCIWIRRHGQRFAGHGSGWSCNDWGRPGWWVVIAKCWWWIRRAIFCSGGSCSCCWWLCEDGVKMYPWWPCISFNCEGLRMIDSGMGCQGWKYGDIWPYFVYWLWRWNFTVTVLCGRVVSGFRGIN